MSSGQGVLWIILWICLNSELLRYHGVQNFAKNDTENAELAVAQTAAFSVSTQKPENDYKIFWLEFLHSSHRTGLYPE